MAVTSPAAPRRPRPDYLFSRLLLIVAAVVVPLLALQAVGILDARSQAERRASVVLREQVGSVAEHTRNHLLTAEHLLSFLSTRRSIRTLEQEACEELMQGATGQGGAYTNIGFFRTDGTHVCSAEPHVPQRSFADRPWFIAGIDADGFMLSEPRRGPVSGRMVLYLTLPVRDELGAKLGLVVAVIDLQAINASLQADLRGPGSIVAVVKDRRQLLTRLPDPERWVGAALPGALPDSVKVAGTRMLIATGLDGERRAFATVPIGKYGLDALAGIPVDAVYGPVNAEVMRAVALALLAIGLGLAAAWLAARRLTGALRSIADTARRLHAGDTDVRADIALPGQFGEVAVELNRLIEGNLERTAQLQQSERHAVQLRRFYETLSATGQAIARQMPPQALYEEVCRACMASGLAAHAWVSLRDSGGLRVATSAHAGSRHRESASRWGNRELLLGERALASGRAAIDTAADEPPMAAVPIELEHERVGVLTLCAAPGVAFDAELVGLLDELARELSFGLYHDRHKAAHEALAAAEAASQAKTHFLSHVSHELRTPLNAVLGFTQLQHARADARQDGEAREQLGHVMAAARQLKVLIDDLMDVSRIEAGELTVEMTDVDIASQLDSVVQLNQPLARRHRVALQLEPEGIDALTMRTDPVRLRQVLTNLVSNAIKYNRPGGSVRLQARCDGRQVTLRVSDNGFGMSQAQLDSLFQAFNRLGRERSAIEGTGIGLFITRRLVQLLGGDIGFDSREGLGTTVTVVLPYQPPRGDGVPSAFAPLGGQAQPADGLAGTVLYIEDNPVNAMLVETYFRQHTQVRLLVCTSGEEGLRQAAELQPDLVLLDMQLPDMHGLEVLRRLAADPRTAAVPVIALSASAMPQEVAAATEAGAQAYWTKPIDFAKLRAGVAAVLAERRGA